MKRVGFYFLLIFFVLCGIKKISAQDVVDIHHSAFYKVLDNGETIKNKSIANNIVFDTGTEIDLEEDFSHNELRDKKVNDFFKFSINLYSNFSFSKKYCPPLLHFKCYCTLKNFFNLVQKSIYIKNQTFLI